MMPFFKTQGYHQGLHALGLKKQAGPLGFFLSHPRVQPRVAELEQEAQQELDPVKHRILQLFGLEKKLNVPEISEIVPTPSEELSQQKLFPTVAAPATPVAPVEKKEVPIKTPPPASPQEPFLQANKDLLNLPKAPTPRP